MSSVSMVGAANNKGTRYHSLDALRAYAMLMGIVLHLAIYFIPFYFTGTFLESSGSDLCTYIVYMTHMFRMQIFFVMAGFFARLVFRRSGYLGFSWHRFTRIAMPFAVGWIIMYPLITLYHVWAAVETEALLRDEPFWSLVWDCIINDELAGFTLIHLWFLYYLLLSYAVVIAGIALLEYVVDRNGRIRIGLKYFFRWLMNSRLNIVWLSLPLWPLLYYKGDWFGIITPADSLKPIWLVVATYTLFFLVGWGLHAQTRLLKRFESRWALNLVVGITISVALFVFFNSGWHQGRITLAYPIIFDNEIRDFSKFRSALLDPAKTGEESNTTFLREALPPLYRDLVDEHPQLTPGQITGVATELSKKLILDPKAFQPANDKEEQLLERLKAESARRGDPPILIDASHEGTPEQNRLLVEAAFPPGLFTKNIAVHPRFGMFMIAFSGIYALGTWYLIFGTTGLFMQFFDNPSPWVRYIADSSYWLYLIHFPILWNINVLTPHIKWHWVPKSLLYLVISLVIMIPSYHYLVRSTWLGKLLNGRTYQFQPLLLRRRDTSNREEDGTTDDTTTRRCA